MELKSTIVFVLCLSSFILPSDGYAETHRRRALGGLRRDNRQPHSLDFNRRKTPERNEFQPHRHMVAPNYRNPSRRPAMPSHIRPTRPPIGKSTSRPFKRQTYSQIKKPFAPPTRRPIKPLDRKPNAPPSKIPTIPLYRKPNVPPTTRPSWPRYSETTTTPSRKPPTSPTRKPTIRPIKPLYKKLTVGLIARNLTRSSSTPSVYNKSNFDQLNQNSISPRLAENVTYCTFYLGKSSTVNNVVPCKFLTVETNVTTYENAIKNYDGEKIITDNDDEDVITDNDNKDVITDNGDKNLVTNNDDENVIKDNDGEDVITDNGNENLVTNNDDENVITDNDGEDVITDNGNENVFTKKNDENVIKDNDGEDVITDNGNENVVTTNNDENVTTDDDGEDVITGNGDENVVTNNNNANAETDNDNETVPTNQDDENVKTDNDNVTGAINHDDENVTTDNDDENMTTGDDEPKIENISFKSIVKKYFPYFLGDSDEFPSHVESEKNSQKSGLEHHSLSNNVFDYKSVVGEAENAKQKLSDLHVDAENEKSSGTKPTYNFNQDTKTKETLIQENKKNYTSPTTSESKNGTLPEKKSDPTYSRRGDTKPRNARHLTSNVDSLSEYFEKIDKQIDDEIVKMKTDLMDLATKKNDLSVSRLSQFYKMDQDFPMDVKSQEVIERSAYENTVWPSSDFFDFNKRENEYTSKSTLDADVSGENKKSPGQGKDSVKKSSQNEIDENMGYGKLDAQTMPKINMDELQNNEMESLLHKISAFNGLPLNFHNNSSTVTLTTWLLIPWIVTHFFG